VVLVIGVTTPVLAGVIANEIDQIKSTTGCRQGMHMSRNGSCVATNGNTVNNKATVTNDKATVKATVKAEVE
jgi:hypothetical protein